MGTAIPLKRSSILIHYDDIIKSTDLFILRIVAEKYYDQFKDYIDIDFYKDISDDDLKYIIFSRTERNIFKWLRKKEFDYEANYTYFKNKYKNIFISALTLDMYNNVHTFEKAYFINNIVFYSREYDPRIEFDIQSNFLGEKFLYVTGPLQKVINTYEIESVHYPYLDESIKEIIMNNKDVFFLIPNYGFNMDDNTGLLKGIPLSVDNAVSYPLIRNTEPKYFG